MSEMLKGNKTIYEQFEKTEFCWLKGVKLRDSTKLDFNQALQNTYISLKIGQLNFVRLLKCMSVARPSKVSDAKQFCPFKQQYGTKEVSLRAYVNLAVSFVQQKEL